MSNGFFDRKTPRYKYFDYSGNRCYFLTICTKDKKCILSDIVDDPEQHYTINGIDVSTSRDGFMPKVKLTHIGEIVDKYILSINNVEGVIVDKYVIMPNHIHLILAIKNDESVVSAERDLNGHSLAINRANEKIPHIVSTFKRFCNKEIGENIFQRSYYDHIIRNIDDYNDTVRYILHNPRRWYLKYKIPKS